MNPGEGRSSGQGRLARRLTALLLCAALAGCATDRANIERNLFTDRNNARRGEGVMEHYRLACPDVLEVRFRDRPELSGSYAIATTGRVELGDYGAVRVEGHSLPEAARLIAEETGQAPGDVEVRVSAFRSQHLFLSGQVLGWQRTVPYQGQETVLDLLQRIGGITPGADVRDVYVVRAHLDDAQRPEVFHVNLQAIVIKHDEKTNIRLLPFDQIYVGESQQSRFEKAFPPWLRPIYEAFWNLLPDPPRRPAAMPPAPTARWVAGS